MSNFEISESRNEGGHRKYDDITYEKRCQLIKLIEEEKWTIKAAAKQMGIKLCTAKHILYLYRRKGKIYRKKGQASDEDECQEQNLNQSNTYYPVIFMPYPVYINLSSAQTPEISKCQQDTQTDTVYFESTKGIMSHQYGAFKPL